ncbi:Plant intracellular Ras-group-related LRR protein [Actinidia chinensis var. chinensis]|uniref:Plant intracellular Ras-group-related LRR protein n=1 Tax=Actinidia chinensis var. chinensis TaxID=1590841 RepID=A0A2R6PUL1_ACTCC|nr:Plant intracellular Ras-group-related LRR protein [Actinidia chinensis var. chinensis]
MDPNPTTFPILSYVMSKLPSIGPKHASDVEFDIEQPRPPAASTEPSFDLEDRMPQLTDPKVIAAMRSAVSEVSQARSVLKTLGDRPDHEAVDTAKSKLAEIESKLSKQLEEIVLSPRPAEVERLEWRSHLAEKEKESRDAAEKQRQMYRAVISVDEMHEAYEKMLKDAEAKLERIYEAAVTGRGVVEEEGGSREVVNEVSEEVVGILQEASGKGLPSRTFISVNFPGFHRGL